jgi:hypothetical protein
MQKIKITQAALAALALAISAQASTTPVSPEAEKLIDKSAATLVTDLVRQLESPKTVNAVTREVARAVRVEGEPAAVNDLVVNAGKLAATETLEGAARLARRHGADSFRVSATELVRDHSSGDGGPKRPPTAMGTPIEDKDGYESLGGLLKDHAKTVSESLVEDVMKAAQEAGIEAASKVFQQYKSGELMGPDHKKPAARVSSSIRKIAVTAAKASSAGLFAQAQGQAQPPAAPKTIEN